MRSTALATNEAPPNQPTVHRMSQAPTATTTSSAHGIARGARRPRRGPAPQNTRTGQRPEGLFFIPLPPSLLNPILVFFSSSPLG